MKIFIKSFTRKKTFKFYFIYFVLLFSFLISIFNIYFCINKGVLEKSEVLINRELVLSTEDNYDSVKNNLDEVKHIESVYKALEEVPGKLLISGSDYEYQIQFDSEGSGIYPEILYGQKIYSNDLGIILSSKVLSVNNLHVDDILGKDCLVEFYNEGKHKIYNSKIVGVFKSEKNKAYISYPEFENITYGVSKENQPLKSYMILVDKQKNTDRVIKEIDKAGYYAEVYNKSMLGEVNTFDTLKNVSTIIILFILVISGILISLIINNLYFDEKYDMAILKSIGYRNIDIFKNNLIKIVFLIITSFSFGILMSFVFTKVITIVFLYLNGLSTIDIRCSGLSILLSLLSVCLILIVELIFLMKKTRKIFPLDIFKK